MGLKTRGTIDEPEHSRSRRFKQEALGRARGQRSPRTGAPLQHNHETDEAAGGLARLYTLTLWISSEPHRGYCTPGAW